MASLLRRPTVYAVHDSLKRDSSGALVRDRDLTPASAFGDLRFLIPGGAPPNDPEVMLQEIANGLADAKPTDFLLLVGHPVAIGLTTALMAQRTGGILNLLKWEPRMALYRHVALRLPQI